MNTDTLSQQVRVQLAHLTNTSANDWHLVWKARFGMQSVLHTVAMQKGSGEVITQPFTCITAINPILSAGHIPVYIDANESDLSLDTTKLQASKSARALIMQHSFGIESNLKRARSFANKHNLLLMEDSANQLGFLSTDKDGAPLADISIHSFGVEKMLSTKFGGAVWVNPAMKDTSLRDAIITDLTSLPKLDYATRQRVHHYRLYNRLTNSLPALRSALISSKLFQPAIMSDELLGRNHGIPALPDKYILTKITKALDGYAIFPKNRQKVATLYRQQLPKQLTFPKHLSKNAAPVRFPILCSNKRESVRLFEALRIAGHYSGKWFQPTLFPGPTDARLYNYDSELYPVAEQLSARILNLPTNVTIKEAREILDVLHRETA